MARDRNAAAQGISALQPKLSDPDADLRFMGLNDLANILNSPGSEYLRQETHTSSRLIEALLKALKDTNGEVQNQALKCVGPLALRTPNEHITPFIDKIVELTKEDIDVSVPEAALRILVSTFPQPHAGVMDKDVREAYNGISRVLIPRLVGYAPHDVGKKPQTKSLPGLLQQQKDQSYSSDAVDVMIEVVKCYGPVLTESELVALAKAAMHIIESPQAGGVVKKRALASIGATVVHLNDEQLNAFMSTLIESFQKPDLSSNNRRFLISTIGTLARSVPKKFGPYLDSLAPYVLSALTQEELDAGHTDDEAETDPETEELREAALVSLEALLASCPTEMQPSLTLVIDSTLRCIKYDPNVAEEDDEEMGGTQDGSDDDITEEAQDDDDDEYAALDDEDAFSDVDDMSWKVRRCAAKTLFTIIGRTTPAEYHSLFNKVAPTLITKLNNEREDSVRLEIIAAITALIQRSGGVVGALEGTGASVASNGDVFVPNSRKRRREDSEAAIADNDLQGLVQTRASPPIEPASPPSGGAGADIATVVPKIVQATVRMWKKAGMALKQAAVIMLRAIALSRNGALADYLQQLEDPITDALKPSTSATSGSATGSSATVASLQVETLTLISTITETNGNRVLVPFVIALTPTVTSVATARNYKVVVETLATLEQFVKALTPPRTLDTNKDHAIHLQTLYDVVTVPILDNNTDLEVRHRAIQVLGVLVARTSATGLLPQASRTKALGILSDRLKNETTRLQSARAIGLIAESARPEDNIGSDWIQEVSLEMANQLRKVDRALRGSCLEALQYMALNPTMAAQYDTKTIQQLQTLLMPLFTTDDLHLLIPALVVMAKIIPTNAQVLVTDDLVKSLCLLTRARLEGPPLKAYLLVIKVIGEQNVGAPLMKGLLSIGTDGEATVLGRAIGTLIVYGGSNIGVSVQDFLKEVNTSQDVRARCLALTVLGEVGFRTGSSSPLGLDVFVQSLSADSDKVRLSAAVALGSASSSNISQAMPVILNSFGASSGQDYLYLHALKEILQHSESAATDVAPYASELWQKLFIAANAEDNLAVGAECLGRLATIEPSTYVSELSKSLQDPQPSVRGTVIAAFRFTLSDTSISYNSVLARTIVDLLKTMLTDRDIGNRRLAITTLNAAIHNKPELILPELGQLLPIVLADSFIKPELIKTVKIGPFTHQEDSGLDLRKSAYSTMYTLLDSPRAVQQLPIRAVFDRILDGIPDDHDIRTLCNIMLQRLIIVDPYETRRRLSALGEKFKVVLGTKLKENAVKQEIEKVNEANSAVIRISLELERAFPSASAGDVAGEMVGWKGYLAWVRKEFTNIVRNIVSDGQ